MNMERMEEELSREREQQYMTKDYMKSFELNRDDLSRQKQETGHTGLIMPVIQPDLLKDADESVTCNICDKTFPRQANLTRHQKIHYKYKDDEQFPCTLCTKKFTSKQRLVFHLRNHNNKIYKCMLCNRKFGKVNNCELCKIQGIILNCPHIAPPYACEDCDKKFTYTLHANYMTDCPFSCKICPEKFVNIKLLRKHLDGHNEKPFECGNCDKKFPSRWKLRLHEQTHFNLTPYRCYMCPQRFSTTGNFKRHLKRVHNIK